MGEIHSTFIEHLTANSRSYIVLIWIIQPDLKSKLALRLSSSELAIILPYFLYLASSGVPEASGFQGLPIARLTRNMRGCKVVR